MKIALYAKDPKPTLPEILLPFLEEVEKRNISVVFEQQFLEQLVQDGINFKNNYLTFNHFDNLPKDTDLFFTFGGDGTILSAVTYLQGSDVPIVGVNTGRLGYLAGIKTADLIKRLDEILNKDFNISERTLVDVSLSDGQIEYPFALNEIAIMRKETTSMITVETYVNNEFLNTFWADGLIVSTPTGSTGYSLSCGGPIISPDTQNIVITAIAPHNLNVRPLVMSNDLTIRMKVNSRVPLYSLSLDSRLESLSTETEITVKKANFSIKLAQLKGETYLNTLRQKLYWGSDSRN